jgi:DNA-binding NarL/FixJ family response regulator
MQQGARVGAKQRVVIVDDSRTMQAALEQIFSLRMGFDVVGVASDVETALAMIANVKPDLVTIDLHMPYIDGKVLLEQLSAYPALHKIVVSAHTSANLQMISTLEQLGADACLDKMELSRNPAAFCAKVHAVVARRKKVVRLPVPSNPVVRAAPEPATAARSYPVPLDERARLAQLKLLGIANDDPDAQLDLITAYLGKTSGFPTCLMTFIDRDHQWVKSAYGFARGSMPRAIAFCNYTLCQEEPFMVPNAPADARFANNPLVTDQPRIRSYFGSPIVTGSGINLGAICLIDTKPRRITPEAVNALRSISQIATQLIEGHHPGLAHAA